jgi:hypothetical protein
LVKQFVTDNHGFSVRVAQVDAPFNPIADFMASPDKAEEISKKALPRDIGGVITNVSEWVVNAFH